MSVYEEIIAKSIVRLDMRETGGAGVVRTLIEAAEAEGLLAPECRELAIRTVLNREESASTALEEGVALPHGRIECVSDMLCMIGIHNTGIPFGAHDGLPTRIFVLLLVPPDIGHRHLRFLSTLSKQFMDTSVRAAILAAQTREQTLSALLNIQPETESP